MGDDTAGQHALVSDRDAFMIHVEGLLDPAYRLATVMLLDYTAAEDAVNDATLRAWNQYHRLHGEVTSFRTWFLSIVAGRCRRVQWWRRLSPGGRGRGIERSEGLPEVLMRLPAGSRAALFCYASLDLPMDEVARIMRTSVGRVRARVYRASQRVQSELQREGAER